MVSPYVERASQSKRTLEDVMKARATSPNACGYCENGVVWISEKRFPWSSNPYLCSHCNDTGKARESE